jgi:hypothetical protein
MVARPSLHTLLQAAVALGVFMTFAVLAQRHVGGSVFLTDQADQLQFFERLLRLEPEGLWGPILTTPDPPTRSLGPLGAILFGVPVALGFGVDAVQAVTSAVLVLTTAGAFVTLIRIDSRLAWVWLILLLANPIVWWNAGMLWANTLLLPAGNMVLMFMALCLSQPTVARWCGMFLTAMFAAQISLVAVTAVPPLAVVAARTGLAAWGRRPGRGAALALAAATLLAVGPYLAAEAMTGFANTAALRAQAANDKSADGAARADIALPILRRAADPAGLMERAGVTGWPAVALGVVVVLVSLSLWGATAWTSRGGGVPGYDAVFWLVAASAVGIAGQVAFFVRENRELLSYHYVAILVPLYSVPPAALAAWLLARGSRPARDFAAAALGLACLTLVIWRAPAWADDYWERTPWTYGAIAEAVDTLCTPGEAARTAEGPAFRSLMPGHDGVVEYLMTRRLVPCRYDEASDRLLAASRDKDYPPSRQEPDGTFRLVEIVDPGIALYRRASVD